MPWLPLVLALPFAFYAVYCWGVLDGRQSVRAEMSELDRKQRELGEERSP